MTNLVVLSGRLTKDIEVRTTASGSVVGNFTLAIERPTKTGAEKETDFPRIVVFGKVAENIEKYSGKGLRVEVQGRLQTGSYKDKDGKMVYKTDVYANNVQFIDWKAKDKTNLSQSANQEEAPAFQDVPDDFDQLYDGF